MRPALSNWAMPSLIIIPWKPVWPDSRLLITNINGTEENKSGKILLSVFLWIKCCKNGQLGTRHHCRDNVTIFSGPKTVKWDLTRCGYSTYLDTEAFFPSFFLSLKLPYIVALSLSRSWTIVPCWCQLSWYCERNPNLTLEFWVPCCESFL